MARALGVLRIAAVVAGFAISAETAFIIWVWIAASCAADTFEPESLLTAWVMERTVVSTDCDRSRAAWLVEVEISVSNLAPAGSRASILALTVPVVSRATRVVRGVTFLEPAGAIICIAG